MPGPPAGPAPPRRRRPSAPMLPGAWPLAGHLPAFRRDRLRLLAACARRGDAVALRLGPWYATVLAHPDHVRAVLVEHQDAVRKSPALRAARVVLGDGLLTSEGETHRRHRRLVQPALAPQRLSRLGESVERQVRRSAATWEDRGVVDVAAAMREITLGVAADVLFGADLRREGALLSRALDDLLDAYESPLLPLARYAPGLPLPPLRRWQAALVELKALVRDRLVAGREGLAGGAASDRPGGDVLSALLRARDERGLLTEQEVYDEVVTLLLAGHETTASTLAWTLWLLSGHEQAHARSGAEAREAATPLAVADADALVWTRAAVSESLRLYPPSWAMGRQALSDLHVGGQFLPRGSLAIVSQWVVHRDPRWWDRPAAFDPGRWLDGRTDHLPAFAYFPFGGGRRRCVGEPMAWAETVLVLAALLRHWRFERVAGAVPLPRALLTLRPAGPVYLRVRRRPGD